jgi:hypothetical protein
MKSKRCDDLVLEIGSLIVNSEAYAKYEWQAISVVGHFSQGERSTSGYVYLDDGDFQAETPGFDALYKIEELREEMKKETDKAWHQCLIHITKPDFKINIQFEYDDPKRWSLKKVSRDISDYAESLKPPMAK